MKLGLSSQYKNYKVQTYTIRFHKDNLKNSKSFCLKIVEEVDSLKSIRCFFIESDWLKVSINKMSTWSTKSKARIIYSVRG